MCLFCGLLFGRKRLNGYDTESNREINWDSRHIINAGIFTLIEDAYSEGNTIYKIKALGIFGVFIDDSSITIFDKRKV